MPPLTVGRDGESYSVVDGHHRYEAAVLGGLTEVRCEIIPGGRSDAILAAAAANATHGLRRSNADKVRAVQMVLGETAAADWSDRQIARHCGVSQPLVSKLRG